MGKVYKAFDPLIERTVAVKTISLRCDPQELDQYRERFYREAKAAGGLNHPHIVTIYDVVESDDAAYIAMELLDGLSLRQMMDAGSRLPVARAARIIALPPDACTSTIQTPSRVAAAIAPATVFGMSWNFRSRNTR